MSEDYPWFHTQDVSFDYQVDPPPWDWMPLLVFAATIAFLFYR